MAVEVDPRDAAFTLAVEGFAQGEHRFAAAKVLAALAHFDDVIARDVETGPGSGAAVAVDVDDVLVRSFEMHVATALKVSRYAAGSLLAHARTLRDLLPNTLAVFVDGRCGQVQAFAAAQHAVGLTDAQAAVFDLEAAVIVGDWARALVERELGQARARVAPEQTIDRCRTAAMTRRVTARPLPDGLAFLGWTAPATDVAAVYDGLRRAAVDAHGLPGETRGIGALMSDVLTDVTLQSLATGAAAGPAGPAGPTGPAGPAYPFERLGDPRVPGRGAIQVELMVIVPAATATGQSDEPAHLAGTGALDAEAARRIVACSRSWTRVEVDPVDDAILRIDTDRRFIPRGLRRLIAARQPECGCGCNQPTHRTDLDHVHRVEYDGRTRHTNLQGLCRTSHQMKDDGHWDVTLTPDGTIHWRSRWGASKKLTPAFRIRTPAAGTTTNDDDVVPF